MKSNEKTIFFYIIWAERWFFNFRVSSAFLGWVSGRTNGDFVGLSERRKAYYVHKFLAQKMRKKETGAAHNGINALDLDSRTEHSQSGTYKYTENFKFDIEWACDDVRESSSQSVVLFLFVRVDGANYDHCQCRSYCERTNAHFNTTFNALFPIHILNFNRNNKKQENCD